MSEYVDKNLVRTYSSQLTFLAQFVILKLHIWESSLTVRLSNPHMRKQEKHGGEDGTEHVRHRHSSLPS